MLNNLIEWNYEIFHSPKQRLNSITEREREREQIFVIKLLERKLITVVDVIHPDYNSLIIWLIEYLGESSKNDDHLSKP